MPAPGTDLRSSRHPTRPHLVEPSRVDPTGETGPTAGQARGPGWRRCGPGRYVPATTDSTTPDQRTLEAGRLLEGRGAVTGWAALHWQGATWLDGRGPEGPVAVPLALVGGQRLSAPSGVQVSRETLDPRDIHEVDQLALTSPSRSVTFAMRHAPSVREAVVVLDMAAAADLISVSEAAAYVATMLPRTGVQQARDAVRLAVENSWSPQESRVRLAWVLDAGLPPPLCNVPVFDRAGRHVATPDLLDLASGLAVEYDGDVHLSRERRARDVVREHAMRDLGLEVAVVVGQDLQSRHRLAHRLASARARARWEPETDRRWTTQPPWWWTPATTVAERCALARRRGALGS